MFVFFSVRRHLLDARGEPDQRIHTETRPQRKDGEEYEVAPSRSNVWTSVKVEVPAEAVGVVIGRQGSNIRLIQDSTNTRIKFSDGEESGKRTCAIVGQPENVRLARQLIMKAIDEQPVIEVSEVKVPNMAISRIIGRNGGTVRSISHSTGVKITVVKDEDFTTSPSSSEDMRRIILKGSKEQIEAAKIQLLEKVAEAEEYRQKISASANKMSLRFRGRQGTQDSEASQSSLCSNGSVHQEVLSSPSSDKFIEAYVSAVNSATHFWLQVVSPRAIDLDKLVTEMTEYYSNEENRDLHELEKVTVDSIVAAKFPYDDSWYRGKVCSFSHNEEDPQQSEVNVYYVDFGDTETIQMNNVCELRTDFLKLSFQAIECFLANISPESGQSEEAADTFEELTYASKWKSVMVRVVGYQQQGTTAIPCVQIIDTNGPMDTDVAEELVKRGLASFDRASPQS
ncbi:tudor and KH domain-containing protein homolog isoform X2 [Portunus trituberculatus]|uniref:tudor and KH domain-containing protein homolog isoform X2 n=1 Tax=Portunus trituberculatus TaxID=210409 RepID=UPI001E1CF379|nr:tudor and KH domain-containing protein homolog isoform X2 [Portunus trituberculatus]